MKFYQEVRSRLGGRALGFDYIFNYLNTINNPLISCAEFLSNALEKPITIHWIVQTALNASLFRFSVGTKPRAHVLNPRKLGVWRF